MEGAAEYFCLHYASYRCFDEDTVALSADYIDIRALFSAALALTLYKLIKSNLPKNFYKKGVSGANDFSFLSGFCIHNYFLLNCDLNCISKPSRCTNQSTCQNKLQKYYNIVKEVCLTKL